jgi:hypothetical protein
MQGGKVIRHIQKNTPVEMPEREIDNGRRDFGLA